MNRKVGSIIITGLLAFGPAVGGCSDTPGDVSATSTTPARMSTYVPPSQGNHPAPGSAPTGTSATFAAPTPTTASPATSFPPRGILVNLSDADGLSIYDTGRYVLGLVNPDTMYASVYRNFRILKASGIETLGVGPGANSGAVKEQGEALFQISPDGRRLAASRTGVQGSEAGWINEDGVFTAASPRGGVTTGPLGESQLVRYRGEGFDNAGNFYYTERHFENELNGQVLRLNADETNVNKAQPVGKWDKLALGGTTVRRDGTVFQSDWELGNLYATTSSGIKTYGPYRCSEWQSYQISIQRPGEPSSTGLLPQSNEVCVTSPVSNPDGSKVAFFANPNSNVDNIINVVNTSGGLPRALSVTPPPGMVIDGLISWN